MFAETNIPWNRNENTVITELSITLILSPFFNRYHCDVCTKSFASKTILISHNSDVHEGLKKYPCKKCEAIFTNRKRMEKHFITMHQGRSLKICEFCGRTYTIKQNLVNHLHNVHQYVTITWCVRGM